MPLLKELEQFGFENKKARIYLAALELGEAKANAIAKKAGLPRPTVYDILEKLAQEGLISFYEKRGVRYFIAENPEAMQRRLQSKQTALAGLMPQLKSVYNTNDAKPAIRFYEGLAGVKAIFEDTLTARNKFLRGILSMADLYKTPGKKFMDDYVARRIKANIKLRVIRSQVKEVEETWPSSAKENRELRYGPDGMIFPETIYIYDNKVGIIGTQKDNFGMIIESDDFHQTQENLFNALWDVSSPGVSVD